MATLESEKNLSQPDDTAHVDDEAARHGLIKGGSSTLDYAVLPITRITYGSPSNRPTDNGHARHRVYGRTVEELRKESFGGQRLN